VKSRSHSSTGEEPHRKTGSATRTLHGSILLGLGIVALASALHTGFLIQGGRLSRVEGLAMGVLLLSRATITWMAVRMRKPEDGLLVRLAAASDAE